MVYAFDTARDACLIIGGDKTGDPRFYQRTVSNTERIWLEYSSERQKRSTHGNQMDCMERHQERANESREAGANPR